MKCYCNIMVLSLILVVVVNSTKKPFKSIKSVKETVTNYEILQPTISFQDDSLPHPSTMVVTIPAKKENFVIELTKNHVMMPSQFTSIYHDEDGNKVVDETVYVNCYYQGEVRGHPDWTVIMSTCHGLQGEFGNVEDRESFFHLEPLSKENSSLQQPHAFYLDTEYEPTQGGCGIGAESLLLTGNRHLKLVSLHLDSKRVRKQAEATRFVEWVIVIDNAKFQLNSNDLTVGVQGALMLANSVDNIYRVHGIRVILTSVVTFSVMDMFPVVSDAESLLNSFAAYVQTSHVDTIYDSMMLITGIDLTGTTVGLAFVGTMCNRRLSAGLTQDSGDPLTFVAAVAAHELGHIFNMEHDDGRVCTCTDPTGGCVMAAAIGTSHPTQFSSCSISDLNELYGFGGDVCLFNSPSMTVGNPVCGNGIPEEGEACDCGSVQECTNNCCNASTCQLVTGAQCALGECCSSECQFMAYGSECRAAAGECDLAEYCLGNKSECPEDFHAANGIPCETDSGYCMEGTCPTHADQCMAIFGTGQGAGLCYDFNVDGVATRNCGRYSNGTFIACDSSNILCGMLHCNADGEYTGIFNGPLTVSTLTIGSIMCSGIRSDEDPFIGQVEEGAKCGDGLICNLKQCVTLESLNLPLPCPTDSNNVICSGHGECNNRGRCSCTVEFEGDACERSRNESLPTDVNECLTENGGCAHMCINMEGSFFCSCNAGFALANDGLNCIDVNECLTENGAGCAHMCSNTEGSFLCFCNPGFALADDGLNCIAVNTSLEFEKARYEVAEDIGLDDLALRICVIASNLLSSRNISLYSSDSSAQGTEDYVPFVEKLYLSAGTSRECIGIIILADEDIEPDEDFTVSVAGFDTSATVTIKDDDDTSFKFIGNSPIVRGNDVTFHLSFGRAVVRAFCSLVIGSQLLAETECTGGRANFVNLRNRYVEWTPKIRVVGIKGLITAFPLLERSFRLAIGRRRRCSVHLVNDGITHFNNTVTIEWGLSGPPDVEQSSITFTCSLNRGPRFQCSSPYTREMTMEPTSLIVRPPRNSGGCNLGIPRTFSF